MLIETLAAMAVSGAGQDITPRVAPRGDYRDSCSGEYVNRGRLYADCRDHRNRIRGTSIELNRCSDYEIRNHNGLLVCGPHRGQYEDRPGGGDDWNPGGPGPGRGEIVVYRDDGFRGRSESFRGAMSDLRSSGMNDQISSMQMRGPWTACTDSHFRGRCQTFSGDVGSLRAAGMNDSISSLRPGGFDGPGGGGWGGDRSEITVFRDAMYRGSTTTFRGEMPNLRSTGFNDIISSMQFRGTWEACTDAYFRGVCRTFSDDVWNLEQHGMNDRISSLRPVGRRGGRW